jgi:hypothetical protein
MVERVHRHLKEGLKARGAQADWPQHLPWVLLNIRTTPTTDSNVSAAEVLYGTTLTLPAQLAAPDETCRDIQQFVISLHRLSARKLFPRTDSVRGNYFLALNQCTGITKTKVKYL